jgi:hypothetical protein
VTGEGAPHDYVDAPRPGPVACATGLPGRYLVGGIEARLRQLLQLVNTEGGAARIPKRAQRVAADTGRAESHPRPAAIRSVHANVERMQLASAAVMDGSCHGSRYTNGLGQTLRVWLNRAGLRCVSDLSL